LPVVATALREAGLLPRWVAWLLSQQEQQPGLFEKAFQRLFSKVGGAVC
jgi:hypothetical protein